MVSLNERLQDKWKRSASQARCAMWSSMEHLPEQAKQAFDDRPLAFTFVAFGVGLGVGVALAAALGDTMFPERAKPVQSFARHAMSTFSHAMPEAVSRHFRG